MKNKFLKSLICLSLPLWAATTGLVVTPQGTGVEGISLRLHSNNSQATTDANGNYTLYPDVITSNSNSAPLQKALFSNGALTLQLDQGGPMHIQIFDLRGKKIFQKNFKHLPEGSHQISDLNLYSSGRFILQISTENSKQTFLINKQNSARISLQKNLSNTIGVNDSITLSFEGTNFATFPFDPTLSNQSALTITRTLGRGLIKSNSTESATSSLLFYSNLNDSIRLTPPQVAAGSESYFFLYTPWRIYNPARTWTANLTTTTNNASQQIDNTNKADSTEIIDFYMVLAEPSSSSQLSSSAPSSSSSPPLSSSVSSSSALSSSSQLRISDMPSNIAPFVNWVWDYRQASGKQDQVEDYKNLIFYPIVQNGGSLNYCVRWQSSKTLNQTQRDGIAAMLKRQINAWAKQLIGFENWPFDEIEVNVVGWAVTDASLIQNPRSNENVYSSYIENDVTFPNLPLPRCPDACARPLQYGNPNYSQCPGYSANNDSHFDLSLWGTTGFVGGAGGDWGQRVSDQNILDAINIEFPHIIGHETGHGFGLPDYYESFQIPDANYTPMNGIDRNYVGDWSKVPAMVMWAGASATLTDADIWSFRKTWFHIKGNLGY